MKKIIVLALSLCICVGLMVTAFAAESNNNTCYSKEKKIVYKMSEKEVNEKLTEIGVPEDLINKMSRIMKEDIAQNTTEFISSELVTRGTIPSYDLEFYVNVYKTSDSSDGRERYKLYTFYRWLNIPFNRYQDPYGIAWDDSIWRAVPDTSYNLDKWKFTGESTWYYADDTALAYADDAGAGWNADLRSGIIDGLEGYSRITIEAQTPGSISGSSQLNANYSHVKSVGSVGLVFDTISVNFSGYASQDSQGIYKNFNY